MGSFGETEKPLLINLDPFSYQFLIKEFSDYFYNKIFDLYYLLKYELINHEKSYGPVNFKNFDILMAVNSASDFSDSDESTSDSEAFRKKLKRYLIGKKVELIDPGFKWYPILRKDPDTECDFRSKFFHYLVIFLRNHRDLMLPDDTDDLLLDQVVVRFEVVCTWAGVEKAEFSETFSQVKFNNLVDMGKGWNCKADPSFFAWSEPPSYVWSYLIH
jgi:hypothetical protein